MSHQAAVAAEFIKGQVGMAKAGVITEAAARQAADLALKHLSPADRQEATRILAAEAQHRR
ncbi:hypothetical protein [Streptomyces sp. PD-S100-1]|uniref:hypothetical protein n=1 Tax=Streptomyces sp. PD-S100-1 TaxID=3394351 RepID=UPI0039BCE9EA